MQRLIRSFAIILSLVAAHAAAQQAPVLPADKIEDYFSSYPIEKLYLSFDKPYYAAGDTLWFKAIMLNAENKGINLSSKIYAELLNDSNMLVQRLVIPLENGLGHGDFSLDAALPDGAYTIRAYSNWQQNFGEDHFFQKSFYIGNAGKNTWLVAADQKLNADGRGQNLDLSIKLTDVKNRPAGLQEVDLILMNGSKRISRATLTTAANGTIITKLPLPDPAGNYSVRLIDRKNPSRNAFLPLKNGQNEVADLQFMPEGGYMVNGIYTKVGFKAIGSDGLGKALKGAIVNSRNEQVAELAPIHNGMGSFSFVPQKDETYFALFNQDGKAQKIPVKGILEEGTTLRIDHLSKADSLMIYIKASPSKRVDEDYQLTAQAGGKLVLAVKSNLKKGYFSLKLPKNTFPDGIVHFTLFSPAQEPLNERAAFINHKQKINLRLKSNGTYGPRDSIALELTAKDEMGNPVAGTFSIAVTDDGQVKNTGDDGNIVSYYLLQSGLKGNIETPGWYFDSPEAAEALDNLLLTQGWTGYNWSAILNKPAVPKYKPELGNDISGRLSGIFKNQAKDVRVNLLSLGKTPLFADTISDNDGYFIFKDLPLIDSPAYIIKIKNARGKAAAATIAVDEFEPAEITAIDRALVQPWYVNRDSTLLNYYRHGQIKAEEKEKSLKASSGNNIEEVVIKDLNPRIIQEVAWDAGIFMQFTEEQLKKTPGKTLFELLKERIPGLNIGRRWFERCSDTIAGHGFNNYLVGMQLIASVRIDNSSTMLLSTGIKDTYNETGFSLTNTDQKIFSVNRYIFSTLTAADIKDIKVYKGCVYYFLEITSRSGKGPWIAPAQGTYVYRPLPVYPGRSFYSPKYAADKTAALPDTRSTIFWEASFITDKDGKATLSFYAADTPGAYSVKAEGTDLLGRFGYMTDKLFIKQEISSK